MMEKVIVTQKLLGELAEIRNSTNSKAAITAWQQAQKGFAPTKQELEELRKLTNRNEKY